MRRRRKTVVAKYPTRLDGEARPQLLGLSPSWQATAARIGLAGSLLIIGFCACVPAANGETPKPDKAPPREEEKLDREEVFGEERAVPPFAGTATVAPIFEHGDGRAATGCVVVAPPAFMSEEDARAVIKEELAKFGIEFSEHDVKMDKIQIEKASFMKKEAGEKLPLTADLVDARKKIAVEFVSLADYHDLGGRQARSTVQEYNFKTVATKVARQISEQNKEGVFGVFYEPTAMMVYPKSDPEDAKLSEKDRDALWEKRWAAATKEATKGSAEQLRQQVRDFAAWLKAHKVI